MLKRVMILSLAPLLLAACATQTYQNQTGEYTSVSSSRAPHNSAQAVLVKAQSVCAHANLTVKEVKFYQVKNSNTHLASRTRDQYHFNNVKPDDYLSVFRYYCVAPKKTPAK
jgi:hypothetical protein